MAKQTFVAKTFASKTFACGNWVGVGVTVVPVVKTITLIDSLDSAKTLKGAAGVFALPGALGTSKTITGTVN